MITTPERETLRALWAILGHCDGALSSRSDRGRIYRRTLRDIRELTATRLNRLDNPQSPHYAPFGSHDHTERLTDGSD